MSQPTAPRSLPEGVARCLRHEVGDLLQSVYAVTAVLKERLPPDWTLERRILAELRGRAEKTRDLIDLVHDLVAPLAIHSVELDLANLIGEMTTAAAARHADKAFRTELAPVPSHAGDPNRLDQLGRLLLDYAARTAGKVILVRLRRSTDALDWTIEAEDGSVSDDHREAIHDPFSRPSHGSDRLKLALANRLAELQNGRFQAANRAGGGFELKMTFRP